MANKNEDVNYEADLISLLDEDGNELQFEVIGSAEIGGVMYYAMVPCDEDAAEEDVCEYVILKAEKDEDGEDILVTVDDDDEFDDVADFFDDMLSDEADYDVNITPEKK